MSFFLQKIILVGTVCESYKIQMSEVIKTDFQGMFAHVKLNKTISDVIKIRKNNDFILDIEEKVNLDSEEFENIYDVFCTNKILAMQVLTSDIIEMFNDFKQISPELTIKGDNLYIRFSINELFETNTSKKPLDYETLKEYYFIIGFVLNLATIIRNNIIENDI